MALSHHINIYKACNIKITHENHFGKYCGVLRLTTNVLKAHKKVGYLQNSISIDELPELEGCCGRSEHLRTHYIEPAQGRI